MSDYNQSHIDFCQTMDEKCTHDGWKSLETNIRIVSSDIRRGLDLSTVRQLLFDKITICYRFFCIVMRIHGYEYADTTDDVQNNLFANWCVQYGGKTENNTIVKKLRDGSWWSYDRKIRFNVNSNSKKRRFDSDTSQNRGAGSYIASSSNEPPTKKQKTSAFGCAVINYNNNNEIPKSFRCNVINNNNNNN
eukprot:467854_1